MEEGGNITIMILGDEGVGKSSLVSTFVSRYFSGQLPGVLTSVRLPPDPALSKCTTTIIDTQEGDATLSNALSLSGNNRENLTPIQAPKPDRSSSFVEFDAGVTQRLAASEDSDSRECARERRGSCLASSSGYEEESVAVLLAATSLFRSVDAIILVYAVDRIDTFRRLENHWLPLIDQYYKGELPVIVVGNKFDLAISHNENIPSRQQIISLLQQFKFVREAFKCSAKKLLNVDEVFLKSQLSVLYPITPLFDLTAGRLTAACSRALTRIFRMFDVDGDGLLSDAELNALQKKIWGVSLTHEDFAGWKTMAAQRDDSGASEVKGDNVIRDGKFTVRGFLAIFDVLITIQNRLEVPWKVLRSLGYDCKLNLIIPVSISPRDGDGLEFSDLHPDDWRLGSSDIGFLRRVFSQFDSDGDGTLSSADLDSIFSVLSIPCPPWSEYRASLYKGCFSFPRIEDKVTPPPSPCATPAVGSPSISHSSSPPSSTVSASGVTISSSPLPSIDISKDSGSFHYSSLRKQKPLSFLSWINHWHMIYTISPLIARAEMFRLGHDFNRELPRIHGTASQAPTMNMSSIFVRALILGSRDSGKRGLVQKLHQLPYPNGHKNGTIYEKNYPATSCSVSKILQPSSSSTTTREGDEMMVHAILTEVPALDMSSTADKRNLKDRLAILLGKGKNGKRPYDIAVLVFNANASNMQSLEFAKDLESSVLTEEMPRVFVGTTCDEMKPRSELPINAPIHEAYEHCKCMDLEPPLITSLREDTEQDSSLLKHLVICTQGEHQVVVPFRSTPHGKKRRGATKTRKVLWIGVLFTAGITVVLGLTLTGKRKVEERGGWLNYFRNMLSFQWERSA